MEIIKSVLGFAGGIHTLLLARLWWLGGFLLAALAGMSWGPLLSLVGAGGFTRGQAVSLFVVLAAQGAAVEGVRRYKETITAGGVIKKEGEK